MSTKRVVIFGAAGRVGSLLVRYALQDGYKVIAFVHKHHDLPDNPRLHIVRGDVYKPSDVDGAVAHADIVMSALGSWGTRRQDVLASAMANIIPAMQKHNVSRIISLTGAEARATGDKLGVVHRFAHMALGVVSGKVLRDGELHIELLVKSDLDWTVVRSPIMRSGNSDSYHMTTKRPFPWQTINRSAVARAMIDQIDTGKHSRQAKYVVG